MSLKYAQTIARHTSLPAGPDRPCSSLVPPGPVGGAPSEEPCEPLPGGLEGTGAPGEGRARPPQGASSLRPPAPRCCMDRRASPGWPVPITQGTLPAPPRQGSIETVAQTPAGPPPRSGAAPPGPCFVHVMRTQWGSHKCYCPCFRDEDTVWTPGFPLVPTIILWAA